MARKRAASEGPKIERVEVDATPLITLETPGEELPRGPQPFVRLRPPADTPTDVVESWRSKIAPHARAVRVVTAPRSKLVASTDREVSRLNLRNEALETAKEVKASPAVIAVLETALAEVGL